MPFFKKEREGGKGGGETRDGREGKLVGREIAMRKRMSEGMEKCHRMDNVERTEGEREREMKLQRMG